MFNWIKKFFIKGTLKALKKETKFKFAEKVNKLGQYEDDVEDISKEIENIIKEVKKSTDNIEEINEKYISKKILDSIQKKLKKSFNKNIDEIFKKALEGKLK